MRTALVIQATGALLLAGSGLSLAAPLQQPGVTDQDQPGVTATPREQLGVSSPAPTPPAKPQQQSPLGAVLPDPPVYGPQEYRNPPSRSGGNGGQSNYYTQPPTTLGEDLGGLHAPVPVEPQKIIVPVGPGYLGAGDAKIAKPDWVPDDVAWNANARMALAQRDVNTFLSSIGVSESRSDRMATGTVVGVMTGAGIAFVVVGVPAAAAGAVGGALIGGTIGGIVGAGLGTLIPVPLLGTVTSGVAGTAIGAAAGAAVGAAVVGLPAALAAAAVGGTIGGIIGLASFAGDGSDYVAPPEISPEPATPAAPAAPAPSLHDQVQQTFTDTTTAAEQAVDFVESQPGGQQVLEGAADVVDAGVEWVQSQPWAPAAAEVATQAAHDAVSWAQAQPPLSDLVTVTIDLVQSTPPFAEGQFGALTDQANAALGAVQAAVAP